MKERILTMQQHNEADLYFTIKQRKDNNIYYHRHLVKIQCQYSVFKLN